MSAADTDDRAFAGRGLAGRLVREALDGARRHGLTVLPFCRYVRSFLATHGESLDLVRAEDRIRVGLPAPPR